MFTHPAITEALASQRRRDLIAQAEAYRLARAARVARVARGGSPARPSLFRRASRLAQPAKRAVTAAAALFAAAAVLIAAPAGTGRWAGPQASGPHPQTQHVSASHFW